MDPITGGWLLATMCGAGITRPQIEQKYITHGQALNPDSVVAEPYRNLMRPSASYAARSESIKKLRELRDLRPGWDGHEAVAPHEGAISTAEMFIQMMPAGLETPRIGLASDGELGFFWEDAAVYIDLSFAEDGTLNYYATTPSGESGGDDIQLHSGEYQELISLLPHVVSARMAA
jgi:hypothetical protein